MKKKEKQLIDYFYWEVKLWLCCGMRWSWRGGIVAFDERLRSEWTFSFSPSDSFFFEIIAKQHFSPINFNDVFILCNYFFPLFLSPFHTTVHRVEASPSHESDFHETLIGISAGADFVKWILKSLLSFSALFSCTHRRASPNIFSNFIFARWLHRRECETTETVSGRTANENGISGEWTMMSRLAVRLTHFTLNFFLPLLPWKKF